MVLFSTISPTACGEIAPRAVISCASLSHRVTPRYQTVDTWGWHANNKTQSEQGLRDVIPNSQALLLTTANHVKLSL